LRPADGDPSGADSLLNAPSTADEQPRGTNRNRSPRHSRAPRFRGRPSADLIAIPFGDSSARTISSRVPRLRLRRITLARPHCWPPSAPPLAPRRTIRRNTPPAIADASTRPPDYPSSVRRPLGIAARAGGTPQHGIDPGRRPHAQLPPARSDTEVSTAAVCGHRGSDDAIWKSPS